ncbi:MAG: hypothetical protein WDA07_06410 [Leucobacter sp.]
MSVLTFAGFGGIAPRLDPTLLPPNGAQIALNCRLQSGGAVEPYNEPVEVYGPVSGTKAIYRFKRATPSDTQWWFTSPNDVDFQLGHVAGDEKERTFYTSDAHEPRYTYSGRAETGGGPYPSQWFRLGVPKPTGIPFATKSGTPEEGTDPELRYYVITFVTSDGQESAPSPVSNGVNWHLGETVTLTYTGGFPAGNYDFLTGKVRIYRTQSGSNGGSFFFAAEVGIAQLNSGWADNVETLGEEIPTDGWDPPDAQLRGLTSMPNGFFAAFKGQDVWFSAPFAPYAWPAGYRLTVDLPIVGMAAFGHSLAVLTIGEPHVFSGADPGLMSGQKLALKQACVSKRGIQTVGNAVFYPSPDGLVSISDAGISIVTENHFTKREWQELKPESMVGASHDGLYIAFYDTGSTKGGLVLDPRNGAITTTDIYATAAFSDTVTDELYLCINSRIQKWDAGVPLTMVWKSKKHPITKPSSFAWGQVIATSYPVTLDLWADGVPVVVSKPVTSDAPFRLPSGFGRFWEVQVQGAQRVLAVHLANEARELASV